MNTYYIKICIIASLNLSARAHTHIYILQIYSTYIYIIDILHFGNDIYQERDSLILRWCQATLLISGFSSPHLWTHTKINHSVTIHLIHLLYIHYACMYYWLTTYLIAYIIFNQYYGILKNRPCLRKFSAKELANNIFCKLRVYL